jgi:transposase
MVFQHDNDPKHTANVVKKYLQNVGFAVLVWPSQSPDLNPIENLWAQVKDQLKARSIKPTSLDELFDQILEEWNRVPQAYIESVVKSMPERCKAVIEAKGFSTKY